MTERSKHVGIKYHFIQDLVEAGVICQEHVESALNVADLGTKVITKRVFTSLSDMRSVEAARVCTYYSLYVTLSLTVV